MKVKRGAALYLLTLEEGGGCAERVTRGVLLRGSQHADDGRQRQGGCFSGRCLPGENRRVAREVLLILMLAAAARGQSTHKHTNTHKHTQTQTHREKRAEDKHPQQGGFW